MPQTPEEKELSDGLKLVRALKLQDQLLKANDRIHELEMKVKELQGELDLLKGKEHTLTVKEAAQRMKTSTHTIYGLVEQGRLRCQRIGIGRGTIRIRPYDLDQITSKEVSPIYKHLRF